MRIADRYTGTLAAIIATAVASSVLSFAALIVTGWIGAPSGPDVPMQIVVILSIVFFWGPGFAAIPAAILGYAVERPLARRLIARRDGGFVEHLMIVVGAALLLWLLLRIVVVLAGPQTRLVDHLSLAVFGIIGLCSAFSWWLLVIEPGRRG